MGREYILCCKACGKESTYSIGSGRLDTKRVAEHLRNDILEGKKGLRAKELLEEYADQDCYPDPSKEIYRCKCGYWESTHPANIIRFVLKPVPFEIDDTDDAFNHHNYKKVIVKRHYRYCPRCNRKMKKMNYIWKIEDVLKLLNCPYCGGELFKRNTIMWD